MSEIRRRLVVVGDDACGKTSLLSAFSRGICPDDPPSTIENCVTEVEVDGKHVELALWDSTADYEYERLRPLTYPGAHAILICFAIDLLESLDNVQENWISEVLHFCPGLPIILVGCKKDLRRDQNAFEEKVDQVSVTPEEGLAVAGRIGARNYLECSAKTGEGIREVFQYATRAALPIHLRPIRCRGYPCLLC